MYFVVKYCVYRVVAIADSYYMKIKNLNTTATSNQSTEVRQFKDTQNGQQIVRGEHQVSRNKLWINSLFRHGEQAHIQISTL